MRRLPLFPAATLFLSLFSRKDRRSRGMHNITAGGEKSEIQARRREAAIRQRWRSGRGVRPRRLPLASEWLCASSEFIVEPRGRPRIPTESNVGRRSQ
jgi:phosphopantetheinyl transferase